jgi:predicted regulator of Ras-like GTPase activity (Roadblock/LC7/MglB family)
VTFSVAESWVEQPLRRFVDDARVRFALLVHPSGQVLGQHGFARSTDVMAACALAAAIHASAGAIGRELSAEPFIELHHAGADRQVFIAEVRTPRGAHVLLAVFDRETSLGLVRLYYGEFRSALAAAAPATVSGPILSEDFERELNHSLAALFGRAPVRQGTGAQTAGHDTQHGIPISRS